MRNKIVVVTPRIFGENDLAMVVTFIFMQGTILAVDITR